MPTDDAAKTPTNPASDAASLRKKQILVVVLLVGLMVALLTQPEKEEEPRGSVSELQTTTVPVVRPVSLAGPTTPSEDTESDAESDAGVKLAEIQPLTRFELDEIVHLELLAPELNPLANSPALEVPEVQAIYGSSDTRAALVGKEIVRRGQPLPGVGKVLSVSDEGIEVSR